MNPRVIEKTLELLKKMFSEAMRNGEHKTAWEISECVQLLKFELDTITKFKEVVK